MINVWLLIFFIVILLFVILCQGNNKYKYGGVLSPRNIASNCELPLSLSSDYTGTLQLYVKPVDMEVIAVDVSSDAITDDLIRQVQVQIGRRVNNLLYQGRPLERNVSLADQNITSESLIDESITNLTIRLNLDQYIIRRDPRRLDEFTLPLQIIDISTRKYKGTVWIPIECIVSREIRHLPLGENAPEYIVVKNECRNSIRLTTSTSVVMYTVSRSGELVVPPNPDELFVNSFSNIVFDQIMFLGRPVPNKYRSSNI